LYQRLLALVKIASVFFVRTILGDFYAAAVTVVFPELKGFVLNFYFLISIASVTAFEKFFASLVV
jgi:hypothetical protein